MAGRVRRSTFRFPRRRRKRRRILRKKFYRYRKRAGRGTFRCKLTKCTTVGAVAKDDSTYQLQVIPAEYDEFLALAPNFEAYRLTKLVVRVLPQQNVSNNSTSRASAYAMLPWHKPYTTGVNSFNRLISVDRAKIYRHTERGRQVYNLNVLQQLQYSDGDRSDKCVWSPRVELRGDGAYKLQYFAGLIAFQKQANPPAEDTKFFFDIVTDVYCTFYNQEIIKES